MLNRIILHIDMDAFFAAVEERNNPHFQGRPIVVGANPKGGKGRGVVSTANYAARKFGIHSAMPISKAWQLYPQAVFLPVDGKLYSEVSSEVRKILLELLQSDARNGILEQAGIDEFYVDASGLDSFQKASAFGKAIKEKIYQKEKLTASVGVGSNKLIAKIASDYKKPDGLIVVKPEDAVEFLAPMPVSKLPGVGPKTAEELRQRKIILIRGLQKLSKETLENWFGKWGGDIFEKAHGVDDREVAESDEIKSIGEQETFELDTLDKTFLVETLMQIAGRVWKSLEDEGFTARTVVIMVRFSNFETKTRSHTLKDPVASLEVLRVEALKLLLPFFDRRENPGQKKIRLLGLRCEKLSL